jgi:hypothetical protein
VAAAGWVHTTQHRGSCEHGNGLSGFMKYRIPRLTERPLASHLLLLDTIFIIIHLCEANGLRFCVLMAASMKIIIFWNTVLRHVV